MRVNRQRIHELKTLILQTQEAGSNTGLLIWTASEKYPITLLCT